MSIQKSIEKLHKQIREAEIESFDDLFSFACETTDTVDQILKNELKTEELLIVDHLLRALRSSQNASYRRINLKANPEVYNKEFDAIEKSLQKMADDSWRVYRNSPPIETTSQGKVAIVYNISDPKTTWHFYFQLGILKSSDSKMEQMPPDKLMGFVRAAILHDWSQALKKAKVTKKKA
jgi:hypothetical protein